MIELGEVIRVDTTQMTGVLLKRGNLNTEMHTGRTLCADKAEIRVMYLEAKERGLEQILPPNPQKEPTQSTP